MKNNVAVLCSGFGLGFYIPGLLVRYQLESNHINTHLYVFENFITEEKKGKIVTTKKEYHQNFSLALVAQKLPFDIRKSLDLDHLESLFREWEQKEVNNFIVLSGHWVYIIDMYRQHQKGKKINVDLLYVDSDLSPSWKSLKKYIPDYNADSNDIWLFHNTLKEIRYKIQVNDMPIIPFEERLDRYLIHGGGWGMGTFMEKISELGDRGYYLDIVAYEFEETKNQRIGNRYFMNDPAWCAWNKNSGGKHEFPLFAKVDETQEPEFTNKKENHRLYDVTREVKAIISKPGAGTMMDSFSSATPIIILDSFGIHEKCNAELWIDRGFGVDYSKWMACNDKEKLLKHLHENLVEANKNTPDYVGSYVERLNDYCLLQNVEDMI